MLSVPAPLAELNPLKTALVILDVQRFVANPDSGLGMAARERGIVREFDDHYVQCEAALRNLSPLIGECRQRGVRVIHSVLATQEGASGPLSRQLRLSGLRLPSAGDVTSEICAEVMPEAGEIVLPRETYSPFTGTDLEQILQAAGVETIILTGLLANLSVLMAAREAADRGLNVVVVHDASASETLEWHGITMVALVGGLIRVQMTHEVVELLDGSRT
jgi:nicotinamidase-related amidase